MPTTKKTSWTPIYIIGTILILAIIVSSVISNPSKKGKVVLGRHCTTSSDCKEGGCFYYKNKKLCLKRCEGEKRNCPVGYHCQTITQPARKTVKYYDICVPD